MVSQDRDAGKGLQPWSPMHSPGGKIWVVLTPSLHYNNLKAKLRPVVVLSTMGCTMKSTLTLTVAAGLQIPMQEFTFTFARSGGPGGQNVNKVSSKALLRWRVRSNTSLPEAVRSRFLARFGNKLTAEGDLLVTSQRNRDAGRNSADCVEKLRRMLASVAQPPKPRRPTKPTRASVRRRLEQKRRHSGRKKQRRVLGDE
jgi:ribosome-associated protein